MPWRRGFRFTSPLGDAGTAFSHFWVRGKIQSGEYETVFGAESKMKLAKYPMPARAVRTGLALGMVGFKKFFIFY